VSFTCSKGEKVQQDWEEKEDRYIFSNHKTAYGILRYAQDDTLSHNNDCHSERSEESRFFTYSPMKKKGTDLFF
jgi:hypothetical protein